MRVYISGKIGEDVISDDTREKFARAEAALAKRGFDVFNPTDAKWQAHLKEHYKKDRKAQEPWLEGKFPGFYEYALLRDEMVLSTCDAIYLLDNWMISPGAKSERAYARATGKEMLFALRDHAERYLTRQFMSSPLQNVSPGENFGDACLRWRRERISEVWIPM